MRKGTKVKQKQSYQKDWGQSCRQGRKIEENPKEGSGNTGTNTLAIPENSETTLGPKEN